MVQIDEPLETSELLAFAETVERRSLSRAALELRVPRATISRRLARLEERLGARLLRRTTRSLALTDAGEALLTHARIVLDAVRTAEASVRRTDDVVRGDLRVSVPPIQTPAFHEMIAGFAAKYPELRVHVQASTQHVDLFRGGFDAAIRASVEIEPGLVARTLAMTPMVPVAAPSYLVARGTPRKVRDLTDHRCLMGYQRGELPETHWPLRRGGRAQVRGAFFTNDLGLLTAMAKRGDGIALLPLLTVLDALEAGALVPVLHGVVGASTRVAVVYPERELIAPQVRAFVDAVVEWAKDAIPRELPPRCAEKEKERGRAKPKRRR